VKKTSPHFDSLQTTDGLAPAGCSMTWPERYCVFVNAVELYRILTTSKCFIMVFVTSRLPLVRIIRLFYICLPSSIMLQ
jgi:hypothetical protein